MVLDCSHHHCRYCGGHNARVYDPKNGLCDGTCPKHPDRERNLFAKTFHYQVLEFISLKMRDYAVSRRELARRLRVSEARVSQMLGKDNNLTLRTVDRILSAIKDQPETP